MRNKKFNYQFDPGVIASAKREAISFLSLLRRLGLLAMTILFISNFAFGQQQTPPAQTQQPPEKKEEFVSVIPKPEAKPAAKEAVKVEEDALNQQQEEKAPLSKEALVSLDYKDAELSAVLKALAYSYGLNIVTLKDIKGKVNITLKNVTVDEALDAILSMNGYTSSKKGNILYISPGPSVDEAGLTTVQMPINYIAGSDAEKLLKPVLSNKGDIKVNPISNSLIVTDFAYNLEKIQKLLIELDVPPPQVLIEAKIVDVATKDLRNLGITLYPSFTGGSGADVRTANSKISMSGPTTSLSEGQIGLGTFDSTTGLPSVVGLVLKHWNITAAIDALIQKNKAHLLASPSIATLSGKEARIIIGSKVGYKETTQTTTGTSQTIKFVDVGTTLRVTPQVSSDGFITMTVHPEVSSLFSNSADTGPTITTREADTTVRVRDGETIVIGGLIKTQNERTVNRVPILGYIPIIGYLFSDRSSDDQQQELAVFITPRIMPKESKEKKQIDAKGLKNEVYVDIEGVGERALSSYMIKMASNLEDGIGAESQEKDELTRKTAAADGYMRVVTSFPKDERADLCVYKAATITYSYLKDYSRAKGLFLQLVNSYPNSYFVSSAQRYIKKIERIEARQQKSKK